MQLGRVLSQRAGIDNASQEIYEIYLAAKKGQWKPGPKISEPQNEEDISPWWVKYKEEITVLGIGAGIVGSALTIGTIATVGTAALGSLPLAAVGGAVWEVRC